MRFRTPVKESEELAYLFKAIAIGLGFGADQRIPTFVAAVVILGIIAARSLMFRKNEKHNLYLNVEVRRSINGANIFQKINQALGKHVLVAECGD